MSAISLDARPIQNLSRRNFVAAAVALTLSHGRASLLGAPRLGQRMYGLISKMTATPGKRDALANILLGGTSSMPGCLSYIIAADPSHQDALWITEVWLNQQKHEASLALPSVKEAIQQGRPLIASIDQRVATQPLGGQGLPAADAP